MLCNLFQLSRCDSERAETDASDLLQDANTTLDEACQLFHLLPLTALYFNVKKNGRDYYKSCDDTSDCISSAAPLK